jgi:hypothetical protein
MRHANRPGGRIPEAGKKPLHPRNPAHYRKLPEADGRVARTSMKISRYLRTFLLAAVVLAIPAASFAGIFISVGIAPPPLPVYAQPAIPAPGYMWTPGYWAWGPGGYYWVPGTWVEPPAVGLLWTPGYWGWSGGVYAFNAGYWGPHIGFYGGVNYGYGYGGVGYEGGYWNHGQFAYNRSVNNISNVSVTNVYNKTVVNNVTVNRTSFNGGAGGIQAQPTAQEQAAVRENHIQPTAAQVQHVNQAQSNPQLRASENGGKPAIAATARPGDFKSAVPARQAGGQVNTATYKAAADNGGKLPANMKDPGGNTPANRPTMASNAEQPRPNAKPAPTAAARPGAEEARPAPAAKPETRPAPAAKPETRPAPAAKPETRPAPEARPEVQPKAQTAPKPAAKPETQARPAAEPRPQAKPKPQAESKPTPQSHPQSKPKNESEGKPKE